MRLTLLVFTISCLLVYSQAYAQRSDGITGGPGQLQVIYEAISFPADSGIARIDVHYRLPQKLFVLVRNPDPTASPEYVGRGEVFVELLNKESVSLARRLQKIPLGSASASESNDELSWCQGMMTFFLPAGEYTVLMDVDDLESGRRVIDRNKKVTTMYTATPRTQLTPVFVYPIEKTATGDTFVVPHNFGGNPLFGEQGSIMAVIPPPDSIGITTNIVYTIKSEGDYEVYSMTDTVKDLALYNNVTLQPVETEGTIKYRISPSSSGFTLLFLPAELERLPLRTFTFTMTVQRGKNRVEFSKRFTTIWPDMPQSLRDVDYALDALRLITRPSQLDSLQSGSYEKRRKNLEDFWQSKDPNPNTPMNEAMAEYYKRVDKATQQFSSLRDNDGVRTDRGKIYVLHGPPSTIRRSLDPKSGFREVWTYETNGKQFIFLDENKSGNYVLVSTKTL